MLEACLDQVRRATHWHADETRWEVFEDLPGKSIKWLTEQGLIEPADKTKPATKAAPKPEPTPKGDED